MAEKYISIPFTEYPALIEVQNYLKSLLPEGTRWQDPATFHITLVYIVDDMGKELPITPPNLPAFGVGTWGLDWFETPDGYAIHLAIEKTPVLVALQTWLFYEAFMAGMSVADTSWPALWRPHITIGYAPELPNAPMSLPTPVHLQAERFTQTAAEYVEVGSYPLMMAMPGVAEETQPVMEMARFMGDWVFSEFKGSYPKKIENFPGVDVSALTAGDDDPKFVHLPVAEADVISANGVFYGEDFVKEVERQMSAKRPIANQGHIADEDRATVFPNPAAFWVGALRIGKTLWGKAYLPPGQMKEIVQRLQAVGGSIATSIYGTGERVWDRDRNAYIATPNKFNLESIDFAPSDRAGVGSLARVPQIVSEMKQEIPTMDKDQIIKELTIGDIPDGLKAAIVEETPEVKMVREMREVWGKDADLVQVMSELKAKQDQIEADAIEAAIVAEIKAVVMPSVTQETDAVKAVRGMIAELVRAQKPTMQTVKDVVGQVAGTEHAKALYSKVVVSEMGGNLGRNVGGNESDNTSGMLDAESTKRLKAAKA